MIAVVVALFLGSLAGAPPPAPPETIPAPPRCIPACLALNGDAYAAAPAVRLGNQDPPFVEPAWWRADVETVDAWARYAPAGLSARDEFDWYRQAFGMPPLFIGIGYRESRHIQDEHVRTSCCVGWLQLWVALHLRDHRLAPRYEACGVDHESDVDGPEPWEKWRHMCAARAVLDVQGMSAWAATR
jgi:hypothetical protein